MSRDELVVVGGGLAGLVAAVTAAEAGADVRLHEAHPRLGGRARSTPGPVVANEGPHVFYADGSAWSWLGRRGLTRPYRWLSPSAGAGIRFVRDGRLRAAPPAGLLRLLGRRRRTAPVDRDFAGWVAGTHGADVAAAASAFAGVATFVDDPGRLSAAFVWERLLRVTNPAGGPRYVVGGWGRSSTGSSGTPGDWACGSRPAARCTPCPAAPPSSRPRWPPPARCWTGR